MGCDADSMIESRIPLQDTALVAEIVQYGGLIDLDSDVLRMKQLLSVIQQQIAVSNVRAGLNRYGLNLDCSRQILNATIPKNLH